MISASSSSSRVSASSLRRVTTAAIWPVRLPEERDSPASRANQPLLSSPSGGPPDEHARRCTPATSSSVDRAGRRHGRSAASRIGANWSVWPASPRSISARRRCAELAAQEPVERRRALRPQPRRPLLADRLRHLRHPRRRRARPGASRERRGGRSGRPPRPGRGSPGTWPRPRSGSPRSGPRRTRGPGRSRRSSRDELDHVARANAAAASASGRGRPPPGPTGAGAASAAAPRRAARAARRRSPAGSSEDSRSRGSSGTAASSRAAWHPGSARRADRGRRRRCRRR